MFGVDLGFVFWWVLCIYEVVGDGVVWVEGDEVVCVVDVCVYGYF